MFHPSSGAYSNLFQPNLRSDHMDNPVEDEDLPFVVVSPVEGFPFLASDGVQSESDFVNESVRCFNKEVSRFRECFRKVLEEVVNKSRSKIHQT